ncbi:MAG: hypothetical protein ACJ8EL_08805 [Rhizomicrobium sp.]
MAVGPGSERAFAPASGPASFFKASVRILLLRSIPLVLAFAQEPWMALGAAFDLLRGNGSTASASDHGAMDRQRHVLNAAVQLLGLSALIVVTLQLTDESAKTYSDEMAGIAAAFMVGSIGFSQSGIRGGFKRSLHIRLADGAFLAGVAALLASIAFAAWQL